MDDKRKWDKVDKAVHQRGGFTADSCLVFFCIRLVVHGEHRVNYDVRDCWSLSNKRRQIPFLSDGTLMPVLFYLAHCRYIHFEDNGKDNDLDASGRPIDRQWKTRAIRDLLIQRNLELVQVGQDLVIDEKVCDTHSKKVYNRIRCRFKPGENEGVLWECLCDGLGIVLNMEEARSDPSGDFSADSVCMRLLQPVLDLGGTGYNLFTDSKYPSIELMRMLKAKGVRLTGTFSCKGKTARAWAPAKEGSYLGGVQSPLEWGEWTCLSRDGPMVPRSSFGTTKGW